MKSIHILMSTYNGEKYLRDQIESLLHQEEVNAQLFVRDDGSTDSTKEILRSYQMKYENIHVYFENNIGYIQSFWKLVRKSKGASYYAFCDQDDIWNADKCISAIRMLEKESPTAPLLYTSNVIPIDNNLQVLNEKAFAVESVLSYPLSLARGSLPGCTFVFNHILQRELQKYHGPQISHDWTVYLIANAIGKIIYDPVPHIQYRIHGDNTIGTGNMTISKKIHRFIHGDYQGVRSSMAQSILDIYGSQLSENKVKVTTAFANQDIKTLIQYPEYRNLNFLIQVLAKKI